MDSSSGPSRRSPTHPGTLGERGANGQAVSHGTPSAPPRWGLSLAPELWGTGLGQRWACTAVVRNFGRHSRTTATRERGAVPGDRRYGARDRVDYRRGRVTHVLQPAGGYLRRP